MNNFFIVILLWCALTVFDNVNIEAVFTGYEDQERENICKQVEDDYRVDDDVVKAILLLKKACLKLGKASKARKADGGPEVVIPYEGMEAIPPPNIVSLDLLQENVSLKLCKLIINTSNLFQTIGCLYNDAHTLQLHSQTV